MTSLWKFFFAFLLVFGICMPNSVAFAGTCVCTTNANDCQAVFLSVSNQTMDACTEECKKILANKFASSKFAEDIEGEIFYQQCRQTHETFVANETAASATPSTSGTSAPKALITPILNIEIPGLKFSDPIVTATTIKTSFLADYLNAIYAFLIGTATIIAIVMIMIGGLQYTIGAASSAQVEKGKDRIKNGVTGLILLLCVFLILKTTNPQLVLQKMIELQNVEEVPLPPPLLAELFEKGDSSAFDPSQGTAEVVDSPDSHKKSVGPDSRLSDADIITAANSGSIDQCFLWSFAKKESGGKLRAIGHDEAYPKNNKPVNSRRDFLVSGKKYSGAIFAPPAGVFDYKTMNSFPVYNNDSFQPNNPPLYGLDWRFRHGIGYLQLTIFPENNGSTGKLIQGPNGPEWARKIRGKWFTTTDLLNADTALEASIRFVGPNCGKKTTVVAAMKCTSVSNAAMGRALAAYQKCPLKKTMTISPEDLAQYPAKASN